MSLRPATIEDLSEILEIERLPEHRGLVGCDPPMLHEQRLASPDCAYFVWREEGKIGGFAILTRLSEPHDVAHLKRIAVRDTGRGLGGKILEAVLGWAFAEAGKHRFELDVFTHNPRAQRVYLRAGFIEEGVLRDAVRDEAGRYRSLKLMSILRPEWQALRTGA